MNGFLENKIVVHTSKSTTFLPIDEVLYIAYNGKNWVLHNLKGEQFALPQQVKAAEILGYAPCLYKVNPQTIINLNHLHSVDNVSLMCRFDVPTDIEICFSRRLYQQFTEILHIKSNQL